MTRSRWTAGLAASFVAFVIATPAQAAPDDGVYGRFDGDLALSLGTGVGIAEGGLRAALLGRALYLDTAGVYASFADAFDASLPASRSFSLGVEVRPLFLARWAQNLEAGPPLLDLTVDSLAFHLGTYWASASSASSTPGLELGMGFDVPLLGRSSGPFVGLRGSLRWRPSDFASSDGNAKERGAIALLVFSWQGRVTARIVDGGDIRKP